MGRIVKQCDKCGRICAVCNEDTLIDKIKDCGGNMIDTGISFEDFNIIRKISSDNIFFKAMVDLKEQDPIEYQLKMSQFKTQLQQQESSKIQNDTTPRCPHCKSTNIKSISGLNRGASIAMWGVFSKKINKSFECKKCGYTW